MTISHGVDGDWRDDERVAAVLDDAELLHVAVTTANGVHVTPTVFDVEGRRIWFLIPRRSVKARAIAGNGRVGGLVRFGDRAVLVSGRARILDPLTARGVFSLGRLLDLPLAASGYLGRNHRHAAGVVRDNPVPTLPLSRVAVALDVSRVALLDGPAMVASWGSWEHRALMLHGDPPAGHPVNLAAVPAQLHSFLDTPKAPVVLGWQSCSGPVPVPGHWDLGSGLVETGAAVMALTGAASASPACMTADRWGNRLDQKRGLLVAGMGRARLAGDVVSAGIQPDRLTYWVGDLTRTIRSFPDPANRRNHP